MAGIAQHFIEFLKPVHIAMAGFCAGKKDDVVLGDVIVSSTVYRYGVGKQLSENELLPEIHAFNGSSGVIVGEKHPQPQYLC